ncbi:replication initiation protein [Lactococcus petauri]
MSFATQPYILCTNKTSSFNSSSLSQNSFGKNPSTQIKGSLDEWQQWFFGNSDRKMSAGEFKAKILTRAAEEIESKLHVEIELLTRKDGRKVTGYEMTIREPRHSSPMLQEDIPFDFGEDYK